MADLEPPDRFVSEVAKYLGECRAEWVTPESEWRLRYNLDVVAPQPSESQLRKLMDAVFYGSIRREEGRPVLFAAELMRQSSLSFLPRAHLVFDAPYRLEPSLIAKLSPSLQRPLRLAVEPDDDLHCWGLVEPAPPPFADLPIEIEATRPGHFALSYFGETRFLYSAGTGVLAGFKNEPDDQFDGEEQLETALPQEPINPVVTTAVLFRLAVAASAGGHGATFIVLPNDVVPKKQVVRAYAVQEAFDVHRAVFAWSLAIGHEREPAAAPAERKEKGEALRNAVDWVAHLAAVDGAVLLACDFRVLAFGAILASKPFAGIVHPRSRPAGSRHNSAINFVGANEGAVAVVVSQDGAVTVITNSGSAVNCRRLEKVRLTRLD